MRIRSLGVSLAVTAAAVGTLAGLSVVRGPAAASSRVRDVRGSVRLQLAPGDGCSSPLGICTSGEVSGDLRGTVSGAAQSFTVPADATVPTVGAYVNHIVFHTADGDLSCTEAGAANTAGSGEFAGLCEVTGGTGHLVGVTGYLLFTGAFSLASGGGSYQYTGRLTYP